MLRRIEIALLDEGVGVMRANPEGSAEYDATGVTAAVEFRHRRWRISGPSTARQILRAIDASMLTSSITSADRPFDLIHAWGLDVWETTIELAMTVGADVVFEVWCAEAAHRILATERAMRRSPEGNAPRGLWSAPDRSATELCSGVAKDWPVRHTPWGVRTPDHTRHARSVGSPASICILASGKDIPSLEIALDGLSRIAKTRPDTLVFLDAAGIDRKHELWRLSQQLGFHDPPSVIAQMESQRHLVLEADLLLVPESRGEHRSLILDAMARGMNVIAQRDRLVDALSNEEMAYLIDHPTPGAWAEAIDRLLDSDAERHRLAGAAVNFIQEHHRPHLQAAGMLEAYAALQSDRPIRFDSSPPKAR